MLVSLNNVSNLQGGPKPGNSWSNVQSAVKSNNVQSFRRIEFKKAKSDFSSNGTAPVEHNGVKKITPEVKKPVVKDTSAGLFDASKATNYVQWKQVSRVGPGFFNDGNTCYLNSTLQCLMYTPALAQIMRNESALVLKNFRQVQDQPKAIIQYFQRLVDEVWTSPAGKSLSPRSMVCNIRRVGKQFKPFRQEDAHEYLRLLLDCMHEEVLKANGVKLSDGKIAETTAISRIFGGYLCNTLTCSKCSYASKTYNHFQDVSLDITSGINSVTNALDHFTKPEYLSQGNEWKCEKCQIKVKAKKQMTFSQLPNVLVLHLKRFSYGNGKNMKPINFSPTLTVTCHKDSGVKKVNYELHGVVVHHGHSTHSGHYIAFVKAPNGSWYEMNDSHVSVVSINKVLSCQAYILFYSRVVPVAAPATTSSTSNGPANGTAQPVSASVAPNGASKTDAVTSDVGVVVKPKVSTDEATKSKVHPVSVTAVSSVPSKPVVKDAKSASAIAPDVSLSESSDDEEEEDSDDDDSDFSEPSDLDEVTGFADAFNKRLNGAQPSDNSSKSKIFTTPKPFRFIGGMGFAWKRRGMKIREVVAQMKELKKARTDDNDETAVKEQKTVVPATPVAVYPAPVKPASSAAVSSNGHAKEQSSADAAPKQAHKDSSVVDSSSSAPPSVKKPSNVVIFNNGISANGTETVKNLIALSNRSKDTGGEGSWDSVSKELAEEAQKLGVQQRREEQKARNEKRLDAWNQKLDEGRVKKVKTGPTAYEAAFASGQQPVNHFQQVQDVRGNSREAYFEAGSAPFEKKRKQEHSNGGFHKHSYGHHQNGKREHNGFNKKQKH